VVPKGSYQDIKAWITKDVSKVVGGEEGGVTMGLLVELFTAHDQGESNVAGKRLAKEENGSSGDNSSEKEVEVTSDKGCSNPESGNDNSGSGNSNPGLDVNMVFMILAEFHASAKDIVEMMLDAGRAVFEKPENPGAHMKPLFIQGHLDRTLIGHMLVDGGPSVNILLLSLFKNLGHIEGDLKCTNLSLSGFAGDPTEAKGIICKELTVRSKTVPTTFFMVDVKGRYNMLLGRYWIHANECVPSSLH
jgi:hypothetical protein